MLKPSAKSVLLPLRLTTAASATDTAIHKKIFRSGFITRIISNEEIKDTMKIVKSFEDSDISIKSVSEAIINEAKEQKWGFLGMLLGTHLTVKGTIRVGEGTTGAGVKI